MGRVKTVLALGAGAFLRPSVCPKFRTVDVKVEQGSKRLKRPTEWRNDLINITNARCKGGRDGAGREGSQESLSEELRHSTVVCTVHYRETREALPLLRDSSQMEKWHPRSPAACWGEGGPGCNHGVSRDEVFSRCLLAVSRAAGAGPCSDQSRSSLPACPSAPTRPSCPCSEAMRALAADTTRIWEQEDCLPATLVGRRVSSFRRLGPKMSVICGPPTS